MSSNNHTIADEEGDFEDWIELYNDSDDPVWLSDCYLSDNVDDPFKWGIPETLIPAHGFLLIYASGKNRSEGAPFHTNFKLKAAGETITLTNASGVLLDSLSGVSLESGKTYGRLLDGQDNFVLLTNPTPGYTNNMEEAYPEIAFSAESGFYDAPFYLKLLSSDTVFYTTDGAVPDLTSQYYTDSIFISSDYPNALSLIPTNGEGINEEFRFRVPQNQIAKSVTIKAIAYKDGQLTGPLYTKTYFTNGGKYSVPVVSITTEQSNLFADESGIYVPGVNYDDQNMYHTGNYNKRGLAWEKQATMVYFDREGRQEFVTPVGLRISGGRSRNCPQKSLRLYFREEYGRSKLEYKFFQGREETEYKRLLLRSSFTYWWQRNTLFQDEIIHTIIQRSDSELDVQASQPVILFLNGEYWGLHNVRERQDEHYLAHFHGVAKDSVDLLGGNLAPIIGSNDDFLALINFIQYSDLSLPENYEVVEEQLDIANFIDYFVFETYFGNRDWPGNNIKMWRSREEGGKWKFLFYDLDAAIGDVCRDPFDFEAPEQKMVKVFVGLCENESFKSQFINRYIYLLETCLAPENVHKIYNEFKDKYEKEVDAHIERWSSPYDYSSWEDNCLYFRLFMETRPCIIKQKLTAYFELEHLNEFDCFYRKPVDLAYVYPNPGNGYLNIVLNETESANGNLVLYDTKGERVLMQPLKQSNHQVVDFSFLQSGMYLLQINSNGRTETEKIIIQN